MLAEQHGLPISRPKFDTIAWDYLIGAGSISPRDWVVNKYKDFKKQQKQGALTTEELVPVLHIPSDNGCCNKGEIGMAPSSPLIWTQENCWYRQILKGNDHETTIPLSNRFNP